MLNLDAADLASLPPAGAAHGQLAARSILCKGVVGKVAATCLFDTGAEANFLAKHFVDKLQLESQLKPSSHSVRYADGTLKEAIGEIELPLRLLADGAPQDATGRFIVADLQRQFDVILGIPFCRRRKPLPDWDSLTIALPDQRPGRQQTYRRVFQAPPRSADKLAGTALSAIELDAMEDLFRRDQIEEWFLINIRPQKPDRDRAVDCGAVAAADVQPPPPPSAEEQELARLRQQMLREYAAVFPSALP